MVDTEQGRIIDDEEIKKEFAEQHPYEQWLKDNLVAIEDLPAAKDVDAGNKDTLLQRQQAFGYTHEDLRVLMAPMAANGLEPTGSMGTDTALAVLSNRSRLLYDYFKQLFAQVTNPPLDGIREELVTQVATTVGPEKNLLEATPDSCKQIRISSPILTNDELTRIREITDAGLKAKTIAILYPVADAGAGLDKALKSVFADIDAAITEGYTNIILSDRGITPELRGNPCTTGDCRRTSSFNSFWCTHKSRFNP